MLDNGFIARIGCSDAAVDGDEAVPPVRDSFWKPVMFTVLPVESISNRSVVALVGIGNSRATSTAGGVDGVLDVAWRSPTSVPVSRTAGNQRVVRVNTNQCVVDAELEDLVFFEFEAVARDWELARLVPSEWHSLRACSNDNGGVGHRVHGHRAGAIRREGETSISVPSLAVIVTVLPTACASGNAGNVGYRHLPGWQRQRH